MYCFDKRNHILDRCLRQYTVTEIEDVTGPSTGLLENLPGLSPKMVLVCKQGNRIEIAHYTNLIPNTFPTFIQRHAPIETNYITAGFAHQLK